jgi:hypothetical protein
MKKVLVRAITSVENWPPHDLKLGIFAFNLFWWVVIIFLVKQLWLV